jgi:hypothetical protein
MSPSRTKATPIGEIVEDQVVNTPGDLLSGRRTFKAQMTGEA